MKYNLYHSDGELIKLNVDLEEVLQSFKEAISDEIGDKEKVSQVLYNQHFTLQKELRLIKSQIKLLNTNEFEGYGLKVRLLPH